MLAARNKKNRGEGQKEQKKTNKKKKSVQEEKEAKGIPFYKKKEGTEQPYMSQPWSQQICPPPGNNSRKYTCKILFSYSRVFAKVHIFEFF